MLKKLIKLANHLDSEGFQREADYLDEIIKIARPEGVSEVKSYTMGNPYANLSMKLAFNKSDIFKPLYRARRNINEGKESILKSNPEYADEIEKLIPDLWTNGNMANNEIPKNKNGSYYIMNVIKGKSKMLGYLKPDFELLHNYKESGLQNSNHPKCIEMDKIVKEYKLSDEIDIYEACSNEDAYEALIDYVKNRR